MLSHNTKNLAVFIRADLVEILLFEIFEAKLLQRARLSVCSVQNMGNIDVVVPVCIKCTKSKLLNKMRITFCNECQIPLGFGGNRHVETIFFFGRLQSSPRQPIEDQAQEP